LFPLELHQLVFFWRAAVALGVVIRPVLVALALAAVVG
jgi:hypothetical protein